MAVRVVVVLALPLVVPLVGVMVSQVAFELTVKFVAVLEDKSTILVPGVVVPAT